MYTHELAIRLIIDKDAELSKIVSHNEKVCAIKTKFVSQE